jgi:riboflavin kinase
MTSESETAEKQFDWTHLYKDEKTFSEPIILEAEIVHGFQRGSKELGIPTANLSMEELGAVGESLGTGIYYGMASLHGQRYEAVVSVGWNPFYKNSKKTIEAHLLATLDDFYGSKMSLELFGYLRPEADFKGLGQSFTVL